MIKKLFLTSLIFFGILGCCGDIPEYWFIEEAQLHFDGTQTADTTYVSGDTVLFQIDLQPGFVEVSDFLLAGTGELWAFQCIDEYGHKGCNDPIVSLNVISDSDFNDIESTNDLKSKVSFFLGSDNYTLVNYLAEMETMGYEYSYLSGAFIETPQDSIQTFTLEIITASNQLFSATSKTIVWQ